MTSRKWAGPLGHAVLKAAVESWLVRSMDPRSKGTLLGASFPRGVMLIGGLFIVVFAAEAAFEIGMARPTMEELTWAGQNNAKLLDALSPIARAYNNVLAMLLACIGLAIPLTANMYTPKLIEIFLRDRINQVILTVFALGAANSLFVLQLIGPGFAPMWAWRIAVWGSLVGWVLLIPYFFYVVRFLDPSTITDRLRGDAARLMELAAAGSDETESLQDALQQRIYQIGTLILKTIDRADRGVALEGIWSLKRVQDRYFELKPKMNDAWFRVDHKDFVGMSHKAIELINERRTWIEMQLLTQLLLSYQHAIAKAPDAISAISNVNRVVATRAAKEGDHHVVLLCIRFFNSFLREALNRRDVRAAYDVLYQYRRLAKDLGDHPDAVRRISRNFVTYAGVAVSAGCPFVGDVVCFDLFELMVDAYEAKNPKAGEILGDLLGMPHERDGVVLRLRVEAKLFAAGYFSERAMDEPRARVAECLSGLPREALAAALKSILGIEEHEFWEITDRGENLEWSPEARRPHIEAFVESLSDR